MNNKRCYPVELLLDVLGTSDRTTLSPRNQSKKMFEKYAHIILSTASRHASEFVRLNSNYTKEGLRLMITRDMSFCAVTQTVSIDGTSIQRTSSPKVNASLTGAHQKAYTDAFRFVKFDYLQENYTS